MAQLSSNCSWCPATSSLTPPARHDCHRPVHRTITYLDLQRTHNVMAIYPRCWTILATSQVQACSMHHSVPPHGICNHQTAEGGSTLVRSSSSSSSSHGCQNLRPCVIAQHGRFRRSHYGMGPKFGILINL